jgi:trigger factor
MMPGQEQQVWDYYRNNPAALAAVRAPLFEDKVVDFLLELADVTDKQVSREELFREEDG